MLSDNKDDLCQTRVSTEVFSHRNLNFQGFKRVLDSYLALNYLSDTQTRGGT